MVDVLILIFSFKPVDVALLPPETGGASGICREVQCILDMLLRVASTALLGQFRPAILESGQSKALSLNPMLSNRSKTL